MILSSCFIPSIMMNCVNVKWTLVICNLTYSVYIGAQFYPQFYTLIPTAIILGIGAAPLWSAQGTYITQVLQVYWLPKNFFLT